MKAAIVGLSVATVAFGGSTIYLRQQLADARERAAQHEAITRQLNARLAELEKSRQELAQRHMGGSNGFISGSLGAGEAVALPAVPPAVASKSGEPEQPVWTMRRHEPSAAMQKMFRKQMRASNRRIYADVGSKLRLDKETTNKLIDLITEQQAAGMNFVMPGEDPAEVARRGEQVQRDHETALNDLIGPDRVVALKEYQKTLPARMEVESLVRQLASNDVLVSEEQRRKLVDVYVEERTRVPYPVPYEGIDPEAYGKSVMAWQDDYENRVSAEATRILDSDQLAAYNEIQQWQKEMRAQLAPIGAAADVQLRRGVASATMFAPATAVGAVSVAIENAPPPAQNPPKR